MFVVADLLGLHRLIEIRNFHRHLQADDSQCKFHNLVSDDVDQLQERRRKQSPTAERFEH